jgi:hypothetical protein
MAGMKLRYSQTPGFWMKHLKFLAFNPERLPCIRALLFLRPWRPLR